MVDSVVLQHIQWRQSNSCAGMLWKAVAVTTYWDSSQRVHLAMVLSYQHVLNNVNVCKEQVCYDLRTELPLHAIRTPLRSVSTHMLAASAPEMQRPVCVWQRRDDGDVLKRL